MSFMLFALSAILATVVLMPLNYFVSLLSLRTLAYNSAMAAQMLLKTFLATRLTATRIQTTSCFCNEATILEPGP